MKNFFITVKTLAQKIWASKLGRSLVVLFAVILLAAVACGGYYSTFSYLSLAGDRWAPLYGNTPITPSEWDSFLQRDPDKDHVRWYVFDSQTGLATKIFDSETDDMAKVIDWVNAWSNDKVAQYRNGFDSESTLLAAETRYLKKIGKLRWYQREGTDVLLWAYFARGDEFTDAERTTMHQALSASLLDIM